MTDGEKNTLRKLLAEDVQWWKKRYPDLVLDDDIRLDEDSCQFYTTTAELLVFGIPRDDLHKLHAGYQIYMLFIDILTDHGLSDECVALVKKARDICPPVRYFGKEFPYQTRCDELQWFEWFFKKFYGISNRTAAAFWHKLSFNLDRLITYSDETTKDHIVNKSDLIFCLKEVPTKRLLCTRNNAEDAGVHWVVRELTNGFKEHDENEQRINLDIAPVVAMVDKGIVRGLIEQVDAQSESVEFEQGPWCSTYVLRTKKPLPYHHCSENI